MSPSSSAAQLLENQEARALAAFGILTREVSSELNLLMLGAFAARATARLILRLCVFPDEGSAEEKSRTYVAVLQRPAYIAWPQLQCTVKIVEWIRHALEVHPMVPFVGWMDSDTWFEPNRLSIYLSAVLNAFSAETPIWGGIFMHYQRLDTNDTLSALGFGMKSPGLVYSWRDPDVAMLRRPKAVRREDSFALTQGSFTYYSRVAAMTIVKYVDRSWQDLHYLVYRGRDKPRGSAMPGVCAVPTDVSMGWLGARAFRGIPLRCVHVHGDFEAYIFPPYLSRLAAHACAARPCTTQHTCILAAPLQRTHHRACSDLRSRGPRHQKDY